MMGVGPVEARTLSLWEYEAMLWHWNDRHKFDGDVQPIERPSVDKVRDRLERLNASALIH